MSMAIMLALYYTSYERIRAVSAENEMISANLPCAACNYILTHPCALHDALRLSMLKSSVPNVILQ